MADATCPRCGSPLPPYAGGPPRKWCSAKCQRGTKPGVMRACSHCGLTFESRRGMTRCSAECRRARDQASIRKSGAERGSYQDRAKFYGVEYVTFSRLSIFERDRWSCGICRRPVDRALQYPDPMSASLDHVVPLSRGGAHRPDNTQCAHLICNIEKGARTPVISDVR